MATARRDLVNRSDPGWLHCTNRCVRRAFLCGVDHYDGRTYEHRKAWVEQRLQRAAQAFCVDVAAYAVMANHIHLVVRMRPDRSRTLSDAEVVDRWLQVFPGFREGRPGQAGAAVPQPVPGLRDALLTDPKRIAEYRDRLGDISWFMRVITEPIARWANAEDGARGRFWEGRFATHPILDLEALIACMVYVDLNPIRACVAETIESSDFTSGQQRARSVAAAAREGEQTPPQRVPLVVPIATITAYDASTHHGGWTEQQYLQVLDATGRLIRADKRGAIATDLPGILERLAVSPTAWSTQMQRSGSFRGTLGRPDRLAAEASRRGRAFVRSACTLFR